MSSNPALVECQGELFPAPFPGESFLLQREGVMGEIDGLRTANGKWSSKGRMFLSNIRLVYIASAADPSGLVAFDLPLVYMRNDKLNQPIFGCNNLSGQVWPAVSGGGPGGALPPHDFKIYFKEGGIGTFYPLYYTLTERAKQSFAGPSAAQSAPAQPNPAQFAEGLVSRAFVDPNDPSTIYLSQPVDESLRLPTAPKYAANYGEDESYLSMDPGAPSAPPMSQATDQSAGFYPAIPPQ
eukprot:gene8155-1408_t